MKLNNKGFAISTLLYSILILFVTLFAATLVILASTKQKYNKIRDNIKRGLEDSTTLEQRILTSANLLVAGNENDYPKENNSVYYIAISSLNIDEDLGNYQDKYVEVSVQNQEYVLRTVNEVIYIFEYKNESQEFKAPLSGIYKIELWGASGPSSSVGLGGYTSGEIELNKNNILYVYTGGVGVAINTSTAGGYNGGGGATDNGNGKIGATGGGATDIRIVPGVWNNYTSLNSRIMVAGGGGGVGGSNQLAYAGGLNGYDGYLSSYQYYSDIGKAATQFAGGTAPTVVTSTATAGTAGGFGTGGAGGKSKSSASSGGGSGGGGGYYGGSGASGLSNGTWPAGGGSSYISGHAGCVAVTSASSRTPRKDSNNTACNSVSSSGYNSAGYNTNRTCSLHYSGKVFSSTVMIDGNGCSWSPGVSSTCNGMPTHDGTSTMKGNVGNGYAKITLISVSN